MKLLEEDEFACTRREITCQRRKLNWGAQEGKVVRGKGLKGLLFSNLQAKAARSQPGDLTLRGYLHAPSQSEGCGSTGHPCVNASMRVGVADEHGRIGSRRPKPQAGAESKLLRLNAGWGRDRLAARAWVGHLQGFCFVLREPGRSPWVG